MSARIFPFVGSSLPNSHESSYALESERSDTSDVYNR